MRLDLSGVIQIQFSFMLVTFSPLILLNFRGNQLCNRSQNIEVICTCHRQEYDLGVLCGAGKSFERGCVAPDAPSLRVARAKEKEVAPDGSRLDWMYDRRSQFIHSRIVPTGVENPEYRFQSPSTPGYSNHWRPRSTECDSREFPDNSSERNAVSFLSVNPQCPPKIARKPEFLSRA